MKAPEAKSKLIYKLDFISLAYSRKKIGHLHGQLSLNSKQLYRTETYFARFFQPNLKNNIDYIKFL